MRPEREAERAAAIARALADPQIIKRFEARFDATDADACWPVQGKAAREGYAQLRVDRLRNVYIQAHRFAYQLYVGPIPDGLVLDHACHNRDLACPGGDTCPHRRCVNPAHLEPVTQRENIRRSSLTNGHKTHCTKGHPYDEENTFIRKNGKRGCRACRTVSSRRYHEKQHVAEKALKSSTENGEAYPGNQNSITDPGEATAPPAGALARRTDKEPFNA